MRRFVMMTAVLAFAFSAPAADSDATGHHLRSITGHLDR